MSEDGAGKIDSPAPPGLAAPAGHQQAVREHVELLLVVDDDEAAEKHHDEDHAAEDQEHLRRPLPGPETAVFGR
jgi:hypothetical protein